MRFESAAERGDLLGELAQMYKSVGRGSDALRAFEAALRNRQNAFDANDAGMLLVGAGRHRAAANVFEAALRGGFAEHAGLNSNAGNAYLALAREAAAAPTAAARAEQGMWQEKAALGYATALRAATGAGKDRDMENAHLYAYNLGTTRMSQHVYCDDRSRLPALTGSGAAEPPTLTLPVKSAPPLAALDALHAAARLMPDFPEAHQKLGHVLDAIATDEAVRARQCPSLIAAAAAEGAVASLSVALRLTAAGKARRIDGQVLRYELHDVLLGVQPARHAEATEQLRAAALELEAEREGAAAGATTITAARVKLAEKVDAALTHMLQYSADWNGLDAARSRVRRTLQQQLFSDDARPEVVPALSPMRALVWLPAPEQMRLTARWASRAERMAKALPGSSGALLPGGAAARKAVAARSRMLRQENTANEADEAMATMAGMAKTATRRKKKQKTKAQLLRLAYLGADFGDNHPVTELMGGVIPAHMDAARALSGGAARAPVMNVTVWSMEPVLGAVAAAHAVARAAHDAGAAAAGRRWQRLHAAVRERGIIDLTLLDDAAASATLRAARPDIIVDLNGFTGGGRPELLAARAAPLQVSYLGWPAALGASYIDYGVFDPFVQPVEGGIEGSSSSSSSSSSSTGSSKSTGKRKRKNKGKKKSSKKKGGDSSGGGVRSPSHSLSSCYRESLAFLPRGSSFFVADALRRQSFTPSGDGIGGSDSAGGGEDVGKDAASLRESMGIAARAATGATAAARGAGGSDDAAVWHARRRAEGLPTPAADDESNWPFVLANFNQVRPASAASLLLLRTVDRM